MAKILDRFGNSIDSGQLRENQTARVTALRGTFAGHPSRGLTPSKLAQIMEAAELGDIRAQHDLFLDMEEKDGHIFAEMSKRKRAILTLDWNVVPPADASKEEIMLAAYAKDMLDSIPNLEDVFLDALDAIGHGFSCLEIEWQRLGKEWFPKRISHRPQSWFQVDRSADSQIRLRDGSLEGQELQRFGWITHVHKAKSGYLPRAGLHRILAWPFLFKNYAVRDLAEFLEIYGLPLRLGKYPEGTSDEEKASLMRAVTQIGHDAAGIIPEGMMIDFMEAASGSHEPFLTMIDWCERTQSKAILGGTLTSQADGKSSTNALGNIHNEVRHDLLASDALQLAGTLTRDLIYPLLAINKVNDPDPRSLPRLVFDVREFADFKLLSEALPKLAEVGVPVPVQWIMDKLRIPQPLEGEPVLKMVQPMANPLLPEMATGEVKHIPMPHMSMKEHDLPPAATGIAVCAYRLPASSSIQLLPAGKFRASDGRPHDVPHWHVNAELAAEIIDRAHMFDNSFVIDYEHQTMLTAQNGQPAPAAGWFKKLEWRRGGLYAVGVKWTERAAAMINAGEYRYISPVFQYDKKTGAVLRFINAALTNSPAIDGMEDVAQRAAARLSNRFLNRG